MIPVANTIVSSRLDYCETLFRRLSAYNIQSLQCIQSMYAWIVTKYCIITSILDILIYWVTININSIFQTASPVRLHYLRFTNLRWLWFGNATCIIIWETDKDRLKNLCQKEPLEKPSNVSCGENRSSGPQKTINNDKNKLFVKI